MVLGGLLAAVLGGLAVVVYKAVCDRLGYVAETSGQVAIGTATYGLMRQVCELLVKALEEWSLRRALVRSLRGYLDAASARRSQPRNQEALDASLRELRAVRAVADRELFDQALRELRTHGQARNFNALSENIEVIAMQALVERLDRS